MQLLLVLVFGLSVNVANLHPHNLADVKADLLNQIKNPVISAGGPYNQ